MLLKFKTPFYQKPGSLFNPNLCQKYCELVLKLWIKICLICPYIGILMNVKNISQFEKLTHFDLII